MLCSEINNLINSALKKVEFPLQWKEFIIVPIHRKCDKTDFSSYRGISLLPTTKSII
jgi:hypothetical protein